MKKSPTLSAIFSAVLVIFVISISCNFANRAWEAGLATPTPSSPTSAALPGPTSPAGEAPSPTQPPATENPPPESPSPTPIPPEAASTEPASRSAVSGGSCTASGCFILARPVGPGGRNSIDESIRYGEYRRGIRDANRGVKFLNSTGTPVVAVADGVVIVAGDDSQTLYGHYNNAYGNLIILRHALPGLSEPVFTLYAHLSQISVDVDQKVAMGQEIGLVGSSGDVSGSTLYFEVRLGENTYQAARNPELWLKPLPDENGQPQGALAGRILDADGHYLKIPNIVLEQLGGPEQPVIETLYISTYSSDKLMGLNPFEENFAKGDLQPGSYQVSFLMNGMQQQVVEVLSGEVTIVTFDIK